MLKVRGDAHTDPGRRREENQDSFFCLPERGFLLVADGMGGHSDGREAGRIVAARTAESVGPGAEPPVGFVAGIDAALPGTVASILASVSDANHEIFETLSAGGEKTAGSTVVAAVAVGSAVYLLNVGDSRAYLIRGGTLTQLTSDHSQVQEMVRAGVLDPAEAAGHPMAHMLTRAVGVAGTVAVDVFALQAAAGDRLVLCSDGLTGELSEDEILAVSSEAADPGDAARGLVRAAVEHGGRDNVTVVIGDIEDTDEAGPEIDLSFLGEARWSNEPAPEPGPRPDERPRVGWREPRSIPHEEVPPGPSWLMGVALVLVALIAYLVWALEKI